MFTGGRKGRRNKGRTDERRNGELNICVFIFLFQHFWNNSWEVLRTFMEGKILEP